MEYLESAGHIANADDVWATKSTRMPIVVLPVGYHRGSDEAVFLVVMVHLRKGITRIAFVGMALQAIKHAGSDLH